MLQWMGGSRRKVTTSRKSTQKRQKQYFEERKRQQQLSSGLESYSNKKVPSRQCHENNRSLDVLSLLNLSKNGQNYTSRMHEGRGSSNNEHTTRSYQIADSPKTSQMEIKNSCPSEHVEIRETRIASKNLEETVCPLDTHPDASERNNDKDAKKMNPNHKLSIVDMLGDDAQNSSPRGNLVHENHVAFSVEGLGNVEMETPVHSPEHPTRNFSYGSPAPSEIYKGSHSFKNLYCSLENKFHELDHVAVGVDIPIDASSSNFPPYLGELSRNSKQNTMVGKECFMNDVEDFISDDKFEFYNSWVEHDKFKWHENSSFLDDKFVDDNCGVSRKNWPYDLDSGMVKYMRSGACDKPDFSFEGLHMQKRRASAKTAGCFNFSGLPSSYKRQMEHDYDFTTCDITRYPTIGSKCGFSETTNCLAWGAFATDDARDQLSFSSEDSCLSHADMFENEVWHEGTKNPLVKSTERKKIRGREADSRSPVNKFNMIQNTFSPEFCTKGLNTWLQESDHYSGLCNRKSDFSTPGNDWIFGEQCNIENAKPGYASMNTSEKIQKVSPFGCKDWNAEPFDSEFNLKSLYEKPSASKSEHDDAFSGNRFSDRVAFCEQVSPDHSSPILPNINVECGHQESFGGLFNEEKECSKIQFQQSVGTKENKSATLPAIGSTLHQHEDKQSNHSSSTNGPSVNVLNSDDKSQFAESKVKYQEMTPGPNALLSPVRSEGGSSSVEMPQKLEACDGLEQCLNPTQTSLLNENEHKEKTETEDAGHAKGDLQLEGSLHDVERSCKVMMVERFVLQLL